MGQHAQSVGQQWQRKLRIQEVQRQYRKDGQHFLNVATDNGNRALRSVVTLGESNTLILLGVEDLTKWEKSELEAGRRKDKKEKHD